ncbi:MAG: UvrD-helicase domain-containing protein [Deltaproteobacteria bacterium]|jgi:ATP-dependent exoDNAse (exonuclease V) beta subunit|nr:UvrD-helicase domain-containing protein [Deltaproteobacteria bacterium]
MIKKFNDSQLAVFESRGNACVVAGAGSGKTGVLVECLARFLEADIEKRSLTSVLALTFSEKAAAEMRERVGQTVRERLKAAAGDPKRRAFWERELRRLGQAEIGTIHSYALSLVRSHSHLLGLPAELSVDADPEDDLEQTLIDLLDRRDPALLTLLEQFPLRARGGSSIAGWLAACVERMSAWGLEELSVGPPEGAEVGDDLPAALAGLRALVLEALAFVEGPDFPRAKKPDLPGQLQGLAELLDAPVADVEADLPRLAAEVSTRIKGLDWPRASKASKQDCKKGLNAALERLVEALAARQAAPVKASLVDVANRLPGLIRARRLARAQVSFDDLLSLARDLLRSQPGVRAQERARWRLVVVDEFQDTNRLQADLLSHLLADAEAPVSGWDKLDFGRLEPRLKVFGDPKQSIYRFRGSEPTIMNRLAAALKAGAGAAPTLDTNYRAQAPLIAFHNAFFPECLAESYEVQKSARPALYDGRALVWLTADAPPRAQYLPAERQAAALVDYLGQLFDGRAGVLVPVLDARGRETGRTRLPKPSDVALLMRRKKNSHVFQQAIVRAGWPCHVLKGRNLFDAPEIGGLAAAYLFLCGREPDWNLAVALSSPLGPVSEEGLTRLAWPEAPSPLRRPLAWYFVDLRRPWPSSVNAADLEVLDELRRLLLSLKPFALRRPAGEILEALVEERRLLPLIIGGADGAPERVKNVQHFLALVKSWPPADAVSPDSAADRLQALRLQGHERGESESEADEPAGPSRAEESGEGELDEGAVNILTVHRAKGLEFPVVVVPEADVTLRAGTESLLISDEGRLALSFKSETSGLRLVPSDFRKLKEDDRRLALEEHRRLFYVAATRARDHLVLVGKAKISADNHAWQTSLAKWPQFDDHVATLKFDDEPDKLDEPDETAAPPAAAARPKPAADGPAGVVDPDEEVVAALVARAPEDPSLNVNVTRYAQLHAAGQLATSDAPWLAPDEPWPASDEPTGKSGAVGPAGPTAPDKRGTLFHAVMEKVDGRLDEARCRALLSDQARLLGLAPSDEEIEFLTAKALRFQHGELGRELAKALAEGREVRREWPFWLRLDSDEFGRGPLYLNGVIDLFFVDARGCGRLVDYKLARPTRSAVYDKQLELYALAVKKAGFPGPVETKLWFSGA